MQVVDGLSEEPVSSADEALELIAQGDAYRKVRHWLCFGFCSALGVNKRVH
jgi:hypothetical protein